MACGPTEGRCAAELTRARSGAKRWRPVCRCPCLAFCRGPLGCGAGRGAAAWRTLTPAEWRSRSTHASPAVPALLVLALDGAVESLLFDSNAPTPPSLSHFVSSGLRFSCLPLRPRHPPRPPPPSLGRQRFGATGQAGGAKRRQCARPPGCAGQGKKNLYFASKNSLMMPTGSGSKKFFTQ